MSDPGRKARVPKRFTTIPTCRSLIKTDPSTKGPKSTRTSRTMITDTIMRGEIAPNVTNPVITHLRCGRAVALDFGHAITQRIYVWEIAGAATCGPGGSPFHLPTR